MVADAMLFSVILTAIIALQRADRTWSQGADEARQITQLVDRLRTDLHAARGVQWNDRDQSMTLETSDGGKIVYERSAAQWRRRAADGTVTLYRRPPGVRCRVTPGDASAGDVVRIVFYRRLHTPVDAHAESIAAELAAAVGRDERLLIP